MIAEGAGKVRMVDAAVDFKPVKTWLGRPATEKVDGWEAEVRQWGWVEQQGAVELNSFDSTACRRLCGHLLATAPLSHHQTTQTAQVYEASGNLVAATWQKAAVVLPPGAPFDAYLAAQLPADVVEEMPLDPLAPPEKPKPVAKGKEVAPAPAGPEPASPLASRVSAPAGCLAWRLAGAQHCSAAPPCLLSNRNAPAHPSSAQGGDAARASFATHSRSSGGSSSFASASSMSGGGGGWLEGGDSPPPSPRSAPASPRSAPASPRAPPSPSSAGASASSSGGGSGGKAAKQKHGKKKARTWSSRCWLARGYPISLAHLIPLLEVVGAGNKHFNQVGGGLAWAAGRAACWLATGLDRAAAA